jgi:hypothetical protein
MALGDSDLAAGVFFNDFGVAIQFGAQQAKGNFDAPGKDAAFSNASVSDQDYRLEVARSAFNPLPKPQRDTVVVLEGAYAGSYKVQAVNPVDDGMIFEISLRRL